MKLFLILVGMGAAGILGYLTEPSFRLPLTGLPAKGEKADVAEQPNPEETAPTPAIDPTTLTPNQLPEKVTLMEEIKFADEASGLTMTIAAGSKAKLIRIAGSKVVVRPGDTAYTISLPVSKTDLMEQLTSKPLPPPQAPEPEPAPQPEPQPAPEPEPQPAPQPEPAPAPTGDSDEPAPMPEPTPEPAPQPEPAPAPQPEPAVEPAPAPEPAPEPAPQPAATAKTVVQVMQESIRDGQIKEFALAQVLKWEAGPNETVDGETYQTGLATYKAETIFGTKNIQAKALVKDGAVARWIWPKSGMEIK